MRFKTLKSQASQFRKTKTLELEGMDSVDFPLDEQEDGQVKAESITGRVMSMSPKFIEEIKQRVNQFALRKTN